MGHISNNPSLGGMCTVKTKHVETSSEVMKVIG